MLLHLWSKAKQLGAAPGANATATTTLGGWATAVELIVLLPLAFHAFYGIRLVLAGRYNIRRYPYSHNWMYTLQRVTGLLVLLFIGYHLVGLWLPLKLGQRSGTEIYPLLCAQLSATYWSVPWEALVYVVGVGLCAFHFGTGIWHAASSWGVAVSRRARRAAGLLAGLLAVLVFIVGANTIVSLATGAGLGPMSSSTGDRIAERSGSCGSSTTSSRVRKTVTTSRHPSKPPNGRATNSRAPDTGAPNTRKRDEQKPAK